MMNIDSRVISCLMLFLAGYSILWYITETNENGIPANSVPKPILWYSNITFQDSYQLGSNRNVNDSGENHTNNISMTITNNSITDESPLNTNSLEDDQTYQYWKKRNAKKARGSSFAGYPGLECSSEESEGSCRRDMLSIASVGRLGNNMWQYSALVGIANLTGRKTVLGLHFAYMKQLFTLSTPIVGDSCKTSFTQVKVRTDFAMDEPHNLQIVSSAVQNMSCNVRLQGYFQSKVYSNHIDLRREFTFTQNISQQIDQYFKSLNLSGDTIKIGIHMRLTQLNTSVFIEQGVDPPPNDYYPRAMEYFRDKFKGRNIVFILTSDDLPLAWKLLDIPDVSLVPNTDPGLDMAIVASCDHVIIGNGTFSWWIGWLCRGITVHYGKIPRKGSVIDIWTNGTFWPANNENNNYVAVE